MRASIAGMSQSTATLPGTTGPTPWYRHPGLIWAGLGLGYLAILLLVYHKVWRGPAAARLYFGWDCLRVYWQDLVFAADALRDGELPLWNPYVLTGYSFYSEPQTGLYSPLNWLLWVAAWISGNRGPWLIQAKVLATMWVGLMGIHAWIHRRHGQHLIGVFGALIFVFGSPLLVFKNSALFWPVAYLPWALIALERFTEAPSLRRGAWLAGGVWLCGSAGSPQGFFFCALILASYYVFLTLGPLPGLGKRLRLQLPILGLVLLLTVLLLLPIYLPAWQAMPYTPRQTRTLEFLLAQPLPTAGLKELLLAHRDTNWFLDIHMGSATMILVAFAIVSATRKTIAHRAFWLGLLLVGVALSMGKETPLLPWLIKNIPGFDLFRIPYRYKLMFIFGIIVLATDGLASLIRRPANWWHRSAWLALLAGWFWYVYNATQLGTTSTTGEAVTAAQQALRWAGGGIVALTVFAWLRLPVDKLPSAWRRHRPGKVVLAVLGHRFATVPIALVGLALLFNDLWVAGETKIKIMQRPPRIQRELAQYPRLAGLGNRTHRTYQNPSRFSTISARVRELSGYYTFPMRLKPYDDLRKRAPRNATLLRRFNVRWVQGRRPGGLRRDEYARRGHGLYELFDPTPLVRVYARAEKLDPRRILWRLGHRAPLEAALVNPADRPPPLPSSQAKPIDGRLVSFRRNRLVLEVDSPHAGIAVINEPFFPGWKARVNGKETRLFRANYLLRGVVVPKGKSRIELVYSPAAYPYLLAGFFLALALLGLGIFFTKWPSWLQLAKGPAVPGASATAAATADKATSPSNPEPTREV